jgi:hypothetical protein
MRHEDERTLDMYRGAGSCEWCRKYVSRREPHHIIARGMGGGKRLDVHLNLVSLCATFSGGDNCHHAVTVGDIAQYDTLAIVAVRESIGQDEILGILHELLRWDKSKPLPERLSRWL